MQHETASVDMLEHLIDVHALKEEFKTYKLHDRDIVFIKELIKGEMTEVQRSVLGHRNLSASIMSHGN